MMMSLSMWKVCKSSKVQAEFNSESSYHERNTEAIGYNQQSNIVYSYATKSERKQEMLLFKC